MISATSMFIALGSLLAVSAQESTPQYVNPLQAKVLLYTNTDGFRHDSIPTAIKQLELWGPYYNVSFDATEDPGKFTTANLAQYDAVLCVHTTGNIFTAAAQTAFADYLNKGGNFGAIHAASAGYMPKTWAPYTNGLGATFDHHPARQNATFVKEMSHPSTDPTPDRWVIEEEVYSFTSDPRKLGAKLLFSVDPTSYKENNVVTAQGTPHPIAWYQDYEAGATIKAGAPGPGVAGRSFYSSLGHKNETWQDPIFMKHVMGGVSWLFGSNTTRVAAGLYNGAEPTVHTGATNTVINAAVSAWSPAVGSNTTAPAPPQPVVTGSPSSSAETPTATGATGTSGNTSGASLVGVPTAMWAVVAASLGAYFGASSL